MVLSRDAFGWVGLVALALLVRVVVGVVGVVGVAGGGGELLGDEREYLALAESLRRGEGLALVDERYAVPQTLLAQRMPGYPVFVAAVGGGANVWVVTLVQALVEASTAVAAVLIARRAGVTKVGAWAAGVCVAVNPFLAYFSTLVLTETLFTACVAWGVFLVLKSRDDGWMWWWAAGVFVVATYLRPTGGPVFLALAGAAVWLPTRGPGGVASRWPLGPLLTATLVIGAALVPWTVRNAFVLGAFVPTTTNGGITLYDGFQPDNVTGGSDQTFVRHMVELNLLSEAARSGYLRDKALAEIWRDPWRAAGLAVRKAGRTWSPVPLSEVSSAVRVAGGAYAVPVFVLAVLGVVRGGLSWRVVVMLLAPMVTLTVLHMASVGSVRYRLPVEPFVAVLAGAGVAVIFGGIGRIVANRRGAADVEILSTSAP